MATENDKPKRKKKVVAVCVTCRSTVKVEAGEEICPNCDNLLEGE